LRHGEQALISDTTEGLAQEAIKILKSKKLADKIGQNGKEFVQDNFDWKVIGKLHDKIYEKIKK